MYNLESYKYVVEIDGASVIKSKSFDSLSDAVNDFQEFAKKHFPDEAFKQTSVDGVIYLVNENTSTKRIEVMFYKMKAEMISFANVI